MSELAGDADAQTVIPVFVDGYVGTVGFEGIAHIRREPAVLQRTVQDPRAQPDFPVGPFPGEQRVAGGMPPEFDGRAGGQPALESVREPQANQAVAAMRCLRPNCLEDRFRFHRGPPVERVEQARDGRYTPPVVAVMRIVPPVFYVQRQVEASGLREAQGSARPGTDAPIMAVAAHPAMPEPQTSRRAAAVEQPHGADFGGNGDVVPLPVDFSMSPGDARPLAGTTKRGSGTCTALSG